MIKIFLLTMAPVNGYNFYQDNEHQYINWTDTDNSTVKPVLTLPMQRLLMSKAQGYKEF